VQVWTQQAGATRGCMSVHATFTEYGDAGKRWRMLESGLWAVVEPAYFTQGNFLTFDLPAPPPDPSPCDGASHAGEQALKFSFLQSFLSAGRLKATSRRPPSLA
jgi:hypothetical protein